MTTEIIIRKGWVTLKEYDLIFTMSKGDSVEHKGIEYRVDYCFLNLATDTMIILVL